MGLARIWWIPAGMSPDKGTYAHVRPRADRRRARPRGRASRRRGDRRGSGHGRAVAARVPRRPAGARHVDALVRARAGRQASPPRRLAARLPGDGRHARHPARRGLPGRRASQHPGQARAAHPARSHQRAAAAADLSTWLATLVRSGLLPAIRAGEPPEATDFTVALYAYLTRTPAVLIGVSLAEAAGEAASAEHARDHRPVPELADPASLPRRRAPAAGRPSRPPRNPSSGRRRIQRPAQRRHLVEGMAGSIAALYAEWLQIADLPDAESTIARTQ